MESNILENSLVHLLDAVTRLDEPIPDFIDIKYAVVHLWSGLKLLLEKRLFDEHWPLGRNNPTYQQNHDNLGSIASPSNFNALKDGLSECCGINIDEYDFVLNKIRKDYNKIEISQFMGSKVQITSNLVSVWPFIVDFISEQIDFSHDSYSRSLFNETCETMDSHLKFVQYRKNEIKHEMANELNEPYAAEPLRCPKCLQDAIPLLLTNSAGYRCSFCNHMLHWQKLAAEYGSDLNWGGPFDCLSCSSQGMLKAENRWICLSCSQAWSIEQIQPCNLCGQRLVWALHDQPYCEPCRLS